MDLTPEQRYDEVMFWLGSQDREHMLFFTMGVQDPALRSQAQRVLEAYDRALAARDPAAMVAVLPASQALKIAVRDAALTRWIGWIYPSFADHVHRELEYFRRRMSPGGVAPRDELCFWNRIGSEHAAFAAGLLDPVAAAGVGAAARGLSAEAGGIANACATQSFPTLLQLSRRSGEALDRTFSGLDLMGTASVIHPALLAHVVREGRRFLGTLPALPANA